MRCEEVVAILRAALPELRSRYTVKDTALFGSVARDETRPDSNLDLPVEFDLGQAGGYFKSFALQEDLEGRLHQTVDLVTPDALKRQLRERILAEAIHAA